MKAQDIYNTAARKIYASYRFLLILLVLLFIFFFLGIFLFSEGALFMIITSSIVGLVLLGFLFVQHQQLRRLENFLRKNIKKEGEFRQMGNLFLSEKGWLFWDSKKGRSGTYTQLLRCTVQQGEGKSITGSRYPVYKVTLLLNEPEMIEVIIKDKGKAEQVISYMHQCNPAMAVDQTLSATEIRFKDLPNQK